MIDTEKMKRDRASELRYEKPVVKDLNLWSVMQELYTIERECEDVYRYLDIDEEALVNTLVLSADEVPELKIIFTEVCAECREIRENLNEERVQSCFDSFFAARNYGRDSKNVWKWLTKDELFIAVRQCIFVYQSFIALRQRYGCLKSAVGLLHDQDIGYLPMAKKMEEAYEKAEKASDRFSDRWCKEVQELDSILYHMPQEAWLQ